MTGRECRAVLNYDAHELPIPAEPSGAVPTPAAAACAALVSLQQRATSALFPLPLLPRKRANDSGAPSPAQHTRIPRIHCA
ncbi:MAG: hypothetical protein EOO41_00515 [Methanobacteriota archaeon]|nr:MAG: hypothetical protein EOO41_00515 [Euryarchaeota archaeon]